MSRSDGEPFPWLRQIRDEHYERTKNMTEDELIEFYRREAAAVRKELESLIRGKARQLEDRSEQPAST